MSEHAGRPSARRVGTASPNMILAVLMVGTFLAPLDSSIVNIALPDIAAQLHVPLTAVSWVATAYLLTSASLVLSVGRVGDVWGLRRLYIAGLMIFGLGSLACSFSPTLGFLVASRVLQAVGAAGLFAAGPAIVARTFPPERRGSALGIISLAIAAGLTAGPALGGVLVGLFGWPSIFLINVPLAVIAAVWAWYVLPADERIPEGFDIPGAVMAAIALLSLLGGITEVSTFGLVSPQILGAFAASAVFGLAFIWWERRAAEPMVDLTLFRAPTFSAGLGAAVLAYMAMFAVVFSMPFYLVKGQQMSEQVAGLVLTATPLAMAVLAPLAGRASDRRGNRGLSTAGLALAAVALAGFSFLTTSTPALVSALMLTTVGAGMALFQTPNTSAVLHATPRGRMGVGSAFIAEARNIGMSVGIALSTALISLRMGSAAQALDSTAPLSAAQANELVSGISLALRAGAVVAAIGAVVSWVWGEVPREQTR